jgi:hypothetical protein
VGALFIESTRTPAFDFLAARIATQPFLRNHWAAEKQNRTEAPGTPLKAKGVNENSGMKDGTPLAFTDMRKMFC